MSFILKEGLSNFNSSVEQVVQIQDVNPRIQKWNTKLILNLCMNYMVHVSNTMWRIKNQPSNSTSCSDNALHLLVLVMGILYWGLQVTSSFSIWGCILKGCFERGIFWRAKSTLKGIKDFNLEHWPQPIMPKNLPEHWPIVSIFMTKISSHAYITLIRSITMFCGTDNILHIQVECEESSLEYCQSHKTLL